MGWDKGNQTLAARHTDDACQGDGLLISAISYQLSAISYQLSDMAGYFCLVSLLHCQESRLGDGV